MINYDRMSKVFCWANSDLDGACSVVLLGNCFPNMEYKPAFFGDFLKSYQDWEHNLDNYDKVFIIGMVLNQELINKIDDKRVVFVSDRGEDLNVFDSTLISEDYSSCCKLLYKKLKNTFKFSINLQQLVAYVDDYNSYKLKYKESEYLNGIYRNMRNRFVSFVNRFWNGYDGLTDNEIKSAEAFFEGIENEYNNLELFEGVFKNWKVLAAFSNKSVNEIAKKMIDNYKHDIMIVVNPETKFVSFRKPEGSSADLNLIATKLCNGGGGEWAAGGKLTEKFLEFTEDLVQIKG